jgi:hypothetical protein
MRIAQIPNIGTVQPPAAVGNFGDGTVQGGAVGALLNTFFNVLLVGAGVYALFNLILAGYSFLSAGDEPKNIENAWAKIYQSVIGLLIAAGSLVLAAIFGQIIFGDPTFLINPVITRPGAV